MCFVLCARRENNSIKKLLTFRTILSKMLERTPHPQSILERDKAATGLEQTILLKLLIRERNL